MENLEEYVGGRSLEELLKEAKDCSVKDKKQIITVQDNKDLLLRIKDKKDNVVFERFYNELLQGGEFSPTAHYLLKSLWCDEREIDLLYNLGQAYYSLRNIDSFANVFNLLKSCEERMIFNNKFIKILADYDLFSVQFREVFDNYEHFFPRVLPLKKEMKVRTVNDELTKKNVGTQNHFAHYGSVGEVVHIYDNNKAEVYFGSMVSESDQRKGGPYIRCELDIVEPDLRNIDALAFNALRESIEQKFARAAGK